MHGLDFWKSENADARGSVQRKNVKVVVTNHLIKISSQQSLRGSNVWFGVGTFGTNDDVMKGLGNCYRMRVRDTVCGDIAAGKDLERWSELK